MVLSGSQSHRTWQNGQKGLSKKKKSKNAIYECDGDRASSLDGFTLTLFQSQWETMKGDILRVFLEFMKDGIMHGVTNET